jgi:hypothetical protein
MRILSTMLRLLAPFIGFLSVGIALADMKVDGSTKETFERSTKSMADTLSDEDKKVFAEGLLNMILTDYPSAKGMDGGSFLAIAPKAVEAAHITMDGKTLSEIMARGRAVISKKAADRPNPSEETAAKGDIDERLACLQQKVVVTSASIIKDSFGSSASFLIQNTLQWPISGIWLAFKATSEGRPVPWIEEDFVVGISSGIQPGESRRVSTSARPPGDAPKNLIVEATVLDVADQDKRLLVGTRNVMGWPKERSQRKCP